MLATPLAAPLVTLAVPLAVPLTAPTAAPPTAPVLLAAPAALLVSAALAQPSAINQLQLQLTQALEQMAEIYDQTSEQLMTGDEAMGLFEVHV